MCDSSLKPWPSNQNAPKITHSLYVLEKANLAGILIGATFYGMSTYGFVHVCSPHRSTHHARDCRDSFLPMYASVVQPLKPQKEGPEVCTRSPHYDYILARDDNYRSELRHAIHFLH